MGLTIMGTETWNIQRIQRTIKVSYTTEKDLVLDYTHNMNIKFKDIVISFFVTDNFKF